MSSKLIGVVGQTGTGKSTAIKFLNPDETYVINVARKELPFKGSGKIYNREKKNYKEVDDANKVSKLLKLLSDTAPHIKQIVIDDSNYIMGFTMVDKATETGYTKFSVMAQTMKNLFRQARLLRDDIKVFYLTHPDIIEDAGEIIGYKIKTAGKLIDSQITLDGLITIMLYTFVEYDKDGLAKYKFLTNRYRKYPAKTPDGMFEDIMIDNNLQTVVDNINEYYN